MSVKCILRLKVFVQISQTDRQTDNMAWLITHIGTFSTLDVNNLVCFEFGASVAYLFFYSGSVTACKMTE